MEWTLVVACPSSVFGFWFLLFLFFSVSLPQVFAFSFVFCVFSFLFSVVRFLLSVFRCPFSLFIIIQVEIWVVEHKVLRAPPQAIRAQNWYILRSVGHIKLARQAPPFFQDFCMKTANMPKLLPLSASAWNAVVDSFKCVCSHSTGCCLLVRHTAQVLHICITYGK